jgi:putative protein-disulfide isomerase
MPDRIKCKLTARTCLSHSLITIAITGLLVVSALSFAVAMQDNESVSSEIQSPQKPKLFYVFDPLCGWCYGFSPVMQKLHQTYKDRLDFQVIGGGMYTGSRVGPIGKVAPYIRTGYRQVEEASGVKFGKAFLDLFNKGTAQFNSVPSCQAMQAFKRQKPDKMVEYAHAIQKAIYYDGVEMEDIGAFANAASAMGADKARFLTDIKSKAVQDSTEADFYLSERFGVQGFPAVFVLKNGKLYPVAEGYMPYEAVAKRVEKALGK